MIIIEDNLFSSENCNKLIEIYSNNKDKIKEWYSTYPLKMNKLQDDELFFSKKIVSVISNFCVSIFGSNLYVERCEITEWPTGSDKDCHYDDARDSTILSSVTYLNDNFVGGKTFFENDLVITPKIGKTIIFNGKQYLHGVTNIDSKTRYTLAIWYTNDINKSLEW